MYAQHTLLNDFNRSWEQIKTAMIELRIDYTKSSWTQEEYDALLDYFTSNHLSLPASDDGVLAVAESHNLELSEVMQAAEATQTLEDLVVWAEELTNLRRQEQIKEAARNQHEKEKLETRQITLAQRLAQTQNTTVDIERLTKLVSLTVSDRNKSMANWSKKPEEVPDFLSEALAQVQSLTKN